MFKELRNMISYANAQIVHRVHAKSKLADLSTNFERILQIYPKYREYFFTLTRNTS